MSIWGKADAAATPDDPFRIEPNWYPAFSVECFDQEKDEQHTLITKWKIQLPGSRFNGFPAKTRHDFYPKDQEELDGEEIQRNSFMKLFLRTGFDLTPDEVASFVPTMGLNKKAMIEVTNSPDKTNPDIIYTNVRAVLCMRLYEERFGNSHLNQEVMSGASMLDGM
jgi:hypothetical protein